MRGKLFQTASAALAVGVLLAGFGSVSSATTKATTKPIVIEAVYSNGVAVSGDQPELLGGAQAAAKAINAR